MSQEFKAKRSTVAVVMSSYNSQQFIAEQVESILAQVDADVRLWIRDDGSTDDTVQILRQLFGDLERVAISTGPNLGACQSFLEALRTCPFDSDYYAFADADDVWLPDKISHSLGVIESLGLDEPVAVATRVEVVDQDLHHICFSAIPRNGLSFSNAMTETVAIGMSTLMNRAAKDQLQYGPPRFAAMHDSWAYLVITALGRFIYSERPTVKYRQHSNNVFGTAHSFNKRLHMRWQRLKDVSVFRKQAGEFLILHGKKLSEQNRMKLQRYCSYPDGILTRITFMLHPSISKQRWQSDLLMRLLVLLGRA